MNQQNIQWTKIQVRQTIGALGIFLSVLILQIFAAVITLALSKVTGITPNSPNYVMFVSMLSAFMAAVWSGYGIGVQIGENEIFHIAMHYSFASSLR